MTKAPTQAPARTRRFRVRAEPYLLIAPALFVLLVMFIAPAVYNFGLSLQNVSFFAIDEGRFVGLANYREMWRDEDLRQALWNTIVWLTAVTVVARLIVGLGLALLVNLPILQRYHVQPLARAMLLLPWVTPPVVAVAAWQWLLHPRYGAVNQLLLEMGLVDQGVAFFAQTSTVWWAIGAIIVWRELPFVAISLLAGLQAIPHELEESARIDGAGRLGVLRHVTLPLLMPVIALVGMLSTIWTFNNFVYVWLSTRGGPGNFTQVLATTLYGEAFFNYRLGSGAAIGVLMSVLMTIFAIVYYRWFLRKQLAA